MAKIQNGTRELVKSFEAKALRKRSFVVRIADELTSSFGSIAFFVFNILLFATWIMVNLGKVPGVPPFDPFPFVLLTTTVSLEAIVLSIIVLMSQNRAGVVNSIREEMDLQINLLSEREITKALQILVKIAEKQGIKLDDPELSRMTRKTDTSYIERALGEQLNPPQENLAQMAGRQAGKVVEPIIKTAQEIGETISVNKK